MRQEYLLALGLHARSAVRRGVPRGPHGANLRPCASVCPRICRARNLLPLGAMFAFTETEHPYLRDETRTDGQDRLILVGQA